MDRRRAGSQQREANSSRTLSTEAGASATPKSKTTSGRHQHEGSRSSEKASKAAVRNSNGSRCVRKKGCQLQRHQYYSRDVSNIEQPCNRQVTSNSKHASNNTETVTRRAGTPATARMLSCARAAIIETFLRTTRFGHNQLPRYEKKHQWRSRPLYGDTRRRKRLHRGLWVYQTIHNLKEHISRRMTTSLNVVVAFSIFRLTKAAGLKGGTQAGAGHPQLSAAPTFKQKWSFRILWKILYLINMYIDVPGSVRWGVFCGSLACALRSEF